MYATRHVKVFKSEIIRFDRENGVKAQLLETRSEGNATQYMSEPNTPAPVGTQQNSTPGTTVNATQGNWCL
jgi:hypothetical protein